MFINFDSFGFAIKVATKNLWQKWFYAGRRFFYHCNGFHVFHAMVFMVFCNGFAIPSCKIYIVPSFLLWSVAKSTKHICFRKMYLSICNLRTSASKLYILFRTIFRCFETGLNNLFKFMSSQNNSCHLCEIVISSYCQQTCSVFILISVDWN